MIVGLASRNQFKAATKAGTVFGKRKPVLKAVGQAIDDAHAESGMYAQCQALLRIRAACEVWFTSNAGKVTYTPNRIWFGGTGSHRYDGVTAIAAQVDQLLMTTYSDQFDHFRRITGADDGRITRKNLTVATLTKDEYLAESLDPLHRSKAGAMYDMYKASGNPVGLTFQDWLADRTIPESDLAQLNIEQFGEPKRVLYLDGVTREPYRLKMAGGRYYRDIDDGDPFDTEDHESAPNKGGWAIFVMSPSGYLYAHSKDVGRFHHSTFLSGGPVAAAGCLRARDGVIVGQNQASGHYAPEAAQQVQFVANVLKQMTRAVGKAQADVYLANTLKVSPSYDTFAFNGPWHAGAHFLATDGKPTATTTGPA